MFRIHRKFKCLAGLGCAGLAGSSAAFLLIVAMMLFVPTTSPSEASAIASDAGASAYASAAPTASLSVPATINFGDVLPSPAGATTTATADITVTTTDSGGYSLYFYASDGDNRLKPLNPANASVVVATAEGSAVALDVLANNTWGYSLGTTAPDASTTYTGVPTDNAAPVQTKDTSDTNFADDTYILSLGAKVDNTIASGTYTNTLTVAVVAEPRALPYIQDFTLADCQSQAADADLTLRDKRDNNEYPVRYINGACWMTQNLRIASGTQLTSGDSNLPDGTAYTIPTADLTLGGSYTEGRVHAGEPSNGESATDTGYWYNYCAASAGQVCSQTLMAATQDICPKGWSLPNKGQIDGLGGTTYLSAFAPVTGGLYDNGTLNITSNGYWWSSAANNINTQYSLIYNGSSLSTSYYYGKSNGSYVRCVRSS